VIIGCLRLVDTEGEPWPCESDTDCANGNSCAFSNTLGRLACVECASRSDCGQLQACLDNACVDVECHPEEVHCAPYACSPDFRCRTDCSSDGHCAEGFACNARECIPDECIEGPNTATCNGYLCVAGRCLTACSGNRECTAGYLCVDGVCRVDECTAMGTVTPPCSGFACALGSCLTACQVDSECAEGYACRAPDCVRIIDGLACENDETCNPGRCCRRGDGTGECAESGKCDLGSSCGDDAACESNSCLRAAGSSTGICAQDCEAGTACPSGWECVPADCTATSECALGCMPSCITRSCDAYHSRLACEPIYVGTGDPVAACVFPLPDPGDFGTGQACSRNGQCSGNNCCPSDTVGVGACAAGPECPAPVGFLCRYDSECASGDCISDDGTLAFCTKECTGDAQCGANEFGRPNACSGNVFGESLCFPGCTEDAQCIQYGDFYSCNYGACQIIP
jgi:hypothetical protein